MTLLDDIRQDMEAGTRGPWFISGSQTVRAGESAQNVLVCKCHWECGTANARRIARVPQLEQIALAAEAMAEALQHLSGVYDCSDVTAPALSAYWKAIEAAE